MRAAQAGPGRARAGGRRRDGCHRRARPGIAGLVNALDPDLVSLGGLAADLAEAAPDALQSSYTAGLMNFRRSTLVPVVPAQLGVDGPLIGAVKTAWDQVLPTLAS